MHSTEFNNIQQNLANCCKLRETTTKSEKLERNSLPAMARNWILCSQFIEQFMEFSVQMDVMAMNEVGSLLWSEINLRAFWWGCGRFLLRFEPSQGFFLIFLFEINISMNVFNVKPDRVKSLWIIPRTFFQEKSPQPQYATPN